MGGTVAGLDRRTFRLNPAYRLVAMARLSRAERRRTRVGALAPDCAGLLLPADPALPVKAVCADTAALLRQLIRPRHLPAAARRVLQADRHALARLVLDSVLEVRGDRRFVTGPDAGPLVLGAPAATVALTRLSQLSLAALKYVAAEPGPPGVLADRLYFYNRAPVSPGWASRLGTARDVERFLGLGARGAVGRLLEAHWSRVPARDREWRGWSARRRDPVAARHKLYLSAELADLPAAFGVAVAAATELGLPGFKIGRDLYGLLRPDKCVFYARSLEELVQFGACLKGALAGARAQGAPFSAALDADGLLSWGVDPAIGTPLATAAGASWRRSIAERLALSLSAAAARAAADIPAWQFALQRIALDGVETDEWTPAGERWSASG